MAPVLLNDYFFGCNRFSSDRAVMTMLGNVVEIWLVSRDD